MDWNQNQHGIEWDFSDFRAQFNFFSLPSMIYHRWPKCTVSETGVQRSLTGTPNR